MPLPDDVIAAALREESPRWKFIPGTRYRELPRVFALQLLAVAARLEPGRRVGGVALADAFAARLHPLLGGLPPDDAEGNTREPEAQGGIGGWSHAAAAWSLLLARETPAVWAQLDAAERERARLIMAALAVAGHLTMGDGNDGHLLLDGVSAHHKSWNINITEGYVDVMMAAGRWFGDGLDAFFRDFEFDAFVAELRAARLLNIARCWTHRPETAVWLMQGGMQALPPASDPLGLGGMRGRVAGVRRPFAFQGIGADRTWALHCTQGYRQFAKAVRTRVIAQAGEHTRLLQRVSAAEVSPYEGRMGMCTELEGTDWYGVRSSLLYAFEGVMIHVGTAASLRALGLWPEEPSARELERRMAVGLADLEFKAREGYRGWHHGREAIAGWADIQAYGGEHVYALWRGLFAGPEGD